MNLCPFSLLSCGFYGKEQADSKENQGQGAKEQGNAGSRVHEEAFRYNVDEHVRGRVQNPQVVAEEDMVEHDEVFGEVSGYDESQGP